MEMSVIAYFRLKMNKYSFLRHGVALKAVGGAVGSAKVVHEVLASTRTSS